MSNKTQLQTNNTVLASLTDRVLAAKDTAAALPDAGGGGSVETCTVTVRRLVEAPRFDVECTESSLEFYSRPFGYGSAPEEEAEISVVKNTLLSIHSYESESPFNYEVTGDVYDYIVGDGILICEVCGDGTVTITD